MAFTWNQENFAVLSSWRIRTLLEVSAIASSSHRACVAKHGISDYASQGGGFESTSSGRTRNSVGPLRTLLLGLFAIGHDELLRPPLTTQCFPDTLEHRREAYVGHWKVAEVRLQVHNMHNER